MAAQGLSVSGRPIDRIDVQEGQGTPAPYDRRIRATIGKPVLSRGHQTVGLVRREVTSCVGPDVLLLEAADGCAGQWPEDAVYRSFVIVQAMQCFLNLPAISRRHLGFR